MIEITVYEFLKSKLLAPVYTEIPNNPPSRMVTIEKTVSSQENQINRATLAIQSYGKSLYEAAELNEIVKETMLDGLDGLITLDEIAKVSLNSDYNFTDTTTKKYRYQAVFEIVHY